MAAKNNEIKPGWKTTEWWLTVTVTLASLLWGADVLDPDGLGTANKGFGFVVAALTGIGYTVCASVSSATASNSPIKSDYADYRVLDSQDESIIIIEAIGVESTAIVSELDLNADEDGDAEFSAAGVNVDNNIFTQFYSLYAKDRDLDVEIDLYGGM